jgi:hypothetical protein
VLRRTSSLKVYEEQRRRQESRERAEIERDFEKLRRQQTGRGGLLNFVRYFWHTLEPKTRAMVEGWPLEAICIHLEALTFGDFPSNRLLMNVPPGFMKSLLVNDSPVCPRIDVEPPQRRAVCDRGHHAAPARRRRFRRHPGPRSQLLPHADPDVFRPATVPSQR